MLKDTQDTDPGFLRERLSMLALRYSGDIKVQRESYARLRVMGGKAKTVIVEELVDQDFAVSRFGSSAGPLGVWKAGGNHEVSGYGHSFLFWCSFRSLQRLLLSLRKTRLRKAKRGKRCLQAWCSASATRRARRHCVGQAGVPDSRTWRWRRIGTGWCRLY